MPRASQPWRERAPAFAVVAALCLLVLHKPWALHTAQLWAEDGSVFLAEAEWYGAGALLRPYAGYLQLIPRLTALAWDPVLDVRWWPLAYNATALLVHAIVLARMASARFDVPHKAWLILAFGLVAQTGETLLNITNVQWISAFLLVEQLLMRPAATRRQLAADLLLVVPAALTGPFAVPLLPLFAWQSWRHRDRGRMLVLAAVAACAVVQAWFLYRSGGVVSIVHPAAFNAGNYLAVIGGRVVVWPLFGREAATLLPSLALALIGTLVAAFVAVRVLVSGDRHGPAATILLSAILLLAAISVRARPDGWSPHDVANGDRYYFTLRVLFVWLVILQLGARQAWIAMTARALCVAGAVLELAHHRIPEPPDYGWAAHCEPIRRGIAADIPTLPPGWILHYPGRPLSPP